MDHGANSDWIAGVMGNLRKASRLIVPAFSECDSSGSVACRRLTRRMQRLKECHESSRLSRAKIFAIGWHVSTALDHLAYQLILCKLNGDAVQRRTALTSVRTKGMAVMTLLRLKNESALPLECGPVLQESGRDGITTPCVHVRAPWGISREMSEGC